MKTRKPSRRNARSREPLACCGARGPLQSSSEAWDVKHVVPATRRNDLCWRHSPEPTFELQVENPSDVLTNLGISGGFLEAPGAPENDALVYALASFGRNPGCRLHAVGSCAEHIAKHALEWRGRQNQANVQCFGAVSDLPNPAPHRRSRLRGLGGLPQTPSAVYAKTRFGAPVYAPRGVATNDAMSRVLGLVFEPPGPPQAAPKIAQHEPLKAMPKQNHCIFTCLSNLWKAKSIGIARPCRKI